VVHAQSPGRTAVVVVVDAAEHVRSQHRCQRDTAGARIEMALENPDPAIWQQKVQVRVDSPRLTRR
jgi:hypothetical protein